MDFNCIPLNLCVRYQQLGYFFFLNQKVCGTTAQVCKVFSYNLFSKFDRIFGSRNKLDFQNLIYKY